MAIVGMIMFNGRNGYGPIQSVGASIPANGVISTVINMTTPTGNGQNGIPQAFGTTTISPLAGGTQLIQLSGADLSAMLFIALVSSV